MSVAGHELTVTIYGRNLASPELAKIRADARTTASSIKSLAGEVATLGASAVAVGKLAEMFGFLSEEQANAVMQFGAIISLSASVVKAFVAIATSSWAVVIAEKARAIAHAVAWALSGPKGWAILAVAATTAAVAIVWATQQIDSATESTQEFNAAVAAIPTEKTVKVRVDYETLPPRAIRRRGEEEFERYRRGVEEP